MTDHHQSPLRGAIRAEHCRRTDRLNSSTDAKNQRTNYSYFADDNLAQITYTDMSGQPLNPPTPSVSYTYDPNYNRILTMVDGAENRYGYFPVPRRRFGGKSPSQHRRHAAERHHHVRLRRAGPGGQSANQWQRQLRAWTFDSLGRLSSDANKLGTFNYSYVGVTERLQTITYPGGTTANYTYFPNLQDKRLQQIKNQTSASVLLSQLDYTYDTEGQLLTWTKNYPGLPTPQRHDLGYDNADQLLTAPLKKTTNNALIRQYPTATTWLPIGPLSG